MKNYSQQLHVKNNIQSRNLTSTCGWLKFIQEEKKEFKAFRRKFDRIREFSDSPLEN